MTDIIYGTPVPVMRKYVQLGQPAVNGDIVLISNNDGKCPGCFQMVDKATHEHFGRKVNWNN